MVILGFGSTAPTIILGALTADASNQFKLPLTGDLPFFILSARRMAPIAVAFPIFLMYRELGLSDTDLGMIVF